MSSGLEVVHSISTRVQQLPVIAILLEKGGFPLQHVLGVRQIFGVYLNVLGLLLQSLEILLCRILFQLEAIL